MSPITRSLVVLFGLGLSLACSDEHRKPRFACPPNTVHDGNICLFSCPPEWTRTENDNKCKPQCPQDFSPSGEYCAPACPPGTDPVGMACEPEGLDEIPESCPAGPGLYNPSGAGGKVIAIDQETGSPLGDGSELAPFDTIQQALEVAASSTDNEITLLLGAGEYQVNNLIIDLSATTLRILGRCADETRFVTSGNNGHYNVNSPGLTLDLRRISFTGGQIPVLVNQATTIEISDSRFEGWTGNVGAVTWVGNQAAESFRAKRSVFSAGASEAIKLLNIEEIFITNNDFQTSSEFAILGINGGSTIHVSSNRFQGNGQWGIKLVLSGVVEEVEISRNRLAGEWSAAVWIDGADGQGTVSFTDNSVDSTGTQGAVFMTNLAAAYLTGDRIGPGSTAGVDIFDVAELTMDRCFVIGSTESNVRLAGEGSTIIDTCYFADAAEEAVRLIGEANELMLSNSGFVENHRGVSVEDGRLTAERNAFGAHSSIAIRAKQAAALTIKENVLASNDSIGIDLVSLTGGSDATYLIEDNLIMESVGLGVSARSCGPGLISVTGNSIYGTIPGTVSNAGISGELGDGVGIMTGTDGIASRVSLKDNSIHGNVRLGVIANGQDTRIEAQGNEFGAGNGYGLSLVQVVDGTPDLLFQDGADVTGADSDRAVEVNGVFVANDPSGESPQPE